MSKQKESLDTETIGTLFMSVEQAMKPILLYGKIITWINTTGKLIGDIFAALFGCAWASTLFMYIFTSNTFYLKIFAGVLAVMLIIAFIIIAIQAIASYRFKTTQSYKDMSDKDSPDKDDINNILFADSKPIKYKVIDKKSPMYGKEFFLYPVHGRVNGNKTITYFKDNQLEIVEINKPKTSNIF